MPAIHPGRSLPTRPVERTATNRRRRPTYWWEIAGVLCLKAVGLALLYFFFFAGAGRPAVTQQAVAQHLLTSPGPATHDEVSHDR